jgi:carbon storage regulator
MLVLTRKVGEQLVIDNRIIVQVVQINGNRIRIGIEAPPEVQIKRQELLQADPCHEVLIEKAGA